MGRKLFSVDWLIRIWNWFLKWKMNKKHLYHLFFYCLNLFTITILTSLCYIDILFFLAVLKFNPLAHFSTYLKNYKFQFWSMIWKPDKILLPMIGVTCMYCKNLLSNGHIIFGSQRFFTPPRLSFVKFLFKTFLF